MRGAMRLSSLSAVVVVMVLGGGKAFAQAGPGACCLPDGSCEIILGNVCKELGGVFQGSDAACAVCLVLKGACCLPGNVCVDATVTWCDDQGGDFQGVGQTCANGFVCGGACCFIGGQCKFITERRCQTAGGIWQGNGNTCSDGLLSCDPLTGACCLGACGVPGGCVEMTWYDCFNEGGVYLGDATECCGANQCGGAEVPAGKGACCLPGNICAELPEEVCQAQGGDFNGLDSSCEFTRCAGACCFLDGTCTFVIFIRCKTAGGFWQGGGTTCGGVCRVGACCLNGDDGVEGAECESTTQHTCAMWLGHWEGWETSCDEIDCDDGGCVTDMDGDGEVGFNEVLDVLANWGICGRRGCSADVDGSGEVDFNDLLMVLADWGGC